MQDRNSLVWDAVPKRNSKGVQQLSLRVGERKISQQGKRHSRKNGKWWTSFLSSCLGFSPSFCNSHKYTQNVKKVPNFTILHFDALKFVFCLFFLPSSVFFFIVIFYKRMGYFILVSWPGCTLEHSPREEKRKKKEKKKKKKNRNGRKWFQRKKCNNSFP